MSKRCFLLFLIIVAPQAQAQALAKAFAEASCASVVHELSVVTPRARLSDLTSPSEPDHDIVASAAECAADSSGIQRRTIGEARVGVVSPVVRLRSQGGVPDPRDQGDVPAVRGTSLFVRAGLSADIRSFHIVFAPELYLGQNRPFDFLPAIDPTKSSFASPFYNYPYNLDLPTRPGIDPVRLLTLGQSAAWASRGPFDIGLSTSSQRWGPGEQDGLQLGADAPGIPRAFIRTRQPVATRFGAWTTSLYYGVLTESRFFDRDSSNDYRTTRAELLAWSPDVTSPLAVGFTHADIHTGTYFASIQPSYNGALDQLTTLFARLRFPSEGVRAWLELGRPGPLPSIRQFLTVPYQGIAYLVGAERALSYTRGTMLLSTEIANLEQPTDVRGEHSQDFYTSYTIPQGWTQRGQVLGYATGPGSQSFHIAADWIAPRWSFGMFADRVRWNEDALFRQYLHYPNRHDVSLSAGMRAGIQIHGQELALQASTGRRINYQFQDATFIPEYRTVDFRIPQLTFTVTPAFPSRK